MHKLVVVLFTIKDTPLAISKVIHMMENVPFTALNNELRVYRIVNSDSLKDVIETSALIMFQKSMECVFEVVKL